MRAGGSWRGQPDDRASIVCVLRDGPFVRHWLCEQSERGFTLREAARLHVGGVGKERRPGNVSYMLADRRATGINESNTRGRRGCPLGRMPAIESVKITQPEESTRGVTVIKFRFRPRLMSASQLNRGRGDGLTDRVVRALTFISPFAVVTVRGSDSGVG